MTTETNAGDGSPKIAIIGTGFGGLCMAIQLEKAGITSFVLLEKAASVGGTWRDNTYPGAACDVQSLLYSFSFEPKSDWTRKYARQGEIRSYLEGCVDTYGLASRIRFNKEVVAAGFDEAAGLWTISTSDGETQRAHILITACGQLNRPAIPRIKGIETFGGKTFHSARWEHDYDFTGKTVGVIGTGASSIQFVPELVPKVKQLKLFQRSAAWIIAKPDRPYTGFEKRLFEKLPVSARLSRAYYYLKNESRALAFTRLWWITRWVEWETRWLAWRAVKDPVKRKKLIPDYRAGCKRILISNDWFPAMNHDHVDVVTDALDHIAHDGIVTRDGKHHPVDAIVYGTGFHATDFLTPMKVTGLNGRSLNEEWRDGAEAYNGICVTGFPNLFMLYGPNTNLSHSSLVYMLESQARYILQGIRALLDQRLLFLNVKSSRQVGYSAKIQEKLKNTIWNSGCSSWYQTASGKNTISWPGYTFNYRLMTGRFNADDYEHRPLPSPVEAAPVGG